MKFPRLTKKRFVGAALAAGLAMGAGGVAFAYFSATATGAGDADVGHYTAHATVTFLDVGTNEAAIFPGTAGVRLTFTVTNTGTKPFRVATATAVVTRTTTTGYVFNSTTTSGHVIRGLPAPGCYSTWFTAHVTHTTGPTSAVGATITPTTTHNQVVTVKMLTNGTTQNACQTVQPFVTLSIKVTNH